jgi:hypothetical protein
MRAAVAVVAIALCAVPMSAADAFVGTWSININESRLHFPEGWRGARLTIEDMGKDTYKLIFLQPGSDGRLERNEEIRVFDRRSRPSKEYESSTLLAERTDQLTQRASWMRNGTPIAEVTSVVSSDGKRMTVRFKGLDARGHQIEEVRIWDRRADAGSPR